MQTTGRLTNVKIIIGNGFDLHCGLRTSYKDYFAFRKDDYDHLLIDVVRDWEPKLGGRNHSFKVVYDYVKKAFDSNSSLMSFNCWDLYFALASNTGFTLVDWYQVEQQIKLSLQKRDDRNESVFAAHWGNVCEYVMNPTQRDDVNFALYGSKLIAAFCLSKKFNGEGRFASKEAFYDYLLEELKEFELSFGVFITKQHVAVTQHSGRFNVSYVTNTQKVFDSLFSIMSSISSVDCFNYAFTPIEMYFLKCNFINGNCLHPIFGVDSVFSPSQPEYIFTKTNRRIELGMISQEQRLLSHEGAQAKEDFNNAIVFGHSLSEADYNYFFPILDQLEIDNYSSKKKFIVAYSIYDKSKEFTIKKRLRKDIYSLFQAYAKYRGKTGNEANRLLDSLTTQGRVETYELPLLPVPKTFEESFVYRNKGFDVWSDSNEQRRKEIVDRWRFYFRFGVRENTYGDAVDLRFAHL